MKTTIHKVFHIDQPINLVWNYLSDPEKIVTCVPGASLTEKVDDRNYKGKMTLKLGPVKTAYNGAITIEELNKSDFTMKLSGKGVDTKGKGSAEMSMKGVLSEKDGGTEVNYNMEVSAVGALAQFGSRLINDVSDQLLNQFIASFRKKLDEEAPAESPPPDPVSGTGQQEADRTTRSPEPEVAKTRDEPDTTTAGEENSLNVLALMWGVVRGFFRRLFGAGK